MEANPKETEAKPMAVYPITKEWLSSQGPQRFGLLGSRDVAGLVCIADESTSATTADYKFRSVTCLTQLSSPTTATVAHGVQRMNDLTVHDIESIRKLQAVGCVIAPGPESVARKYGWAYMDEDMKDGDAGGVRFRLPQGKGILDLFPEGTLEDDEKIVMMAVPTTIAFGYGANPPTGSLDEAGEDLAEVNQDVDLDQVGMMIKVLEHNHFYSYHRKLDDCEQKAGMFVDDLDDDFVRSIGGLE